MLKRDSKGRFIKSAKKEVQKELEAVGESVNVSEYVPSGNTSKNNVKRDDKGKFIKSEKKIPCHVVEAQDGGIIMDVNVFKKEKDRHGVSTIGLPVSKNHIKQPLFVKPVLCHTCGFDYLKKRIPILQKRDEEGDKSGIYFCKKCAEVQRG